MWETFFGQFPAMNYIRTQTITLKCINFFVQANNLIVYAKWEIHLSQMTRASSLSPINMMSFFPGIPFSFIMINLVKFDLRMRQNEHKRIQGNCDYKQCRLLWKLLGIAIIHIFRVISYFRENKFHFHFR